MIFIKVDQDKIELQKVSFGHRNEIKGSDFLVY